MLVTVVARHNICCACSHCRQEVTALEVALEAAEKAAAAAEARACEAEHSVSAAQDALKACPALPSAVTLDELTTAATNTNVVLFPCG